MNQFINTRYNLATSCFTWIVCTAVFPLFDWSSNQKIGILVMPQGFSFFFKATTVACKQWMNRGSAVQKRPLLSVCTSLTAGQKRINTHRGAHVCTLGRAGCLRTPGCMCASDPGLRKVIVGSFVLHASCLKTVTGGGNAQNVDDLYWITLQWRSALTRGEPRSPKGGGVGAGSGGF